MEFPAPFGGRDNGFGRRLGRSEMNGPPSFPRQRIRAFGGVSFFQPRTTFTLKKWCGVNLHFCL